MQLRQVGDLLAARRRALALLVHNLGTVSRATSVKDAQLGQVVRAGQQTLGALASQDLALRQSITRLPGTLATTRTTLLDTAGLANQLGPAATALRPVARGLPKMLRQLPTLFNSAAVVPLTEIKPFVNAVTPLSSQLLPLSGTLTQLVPPLISSFRVLGYVTNELAYNSGARNPGFLYWLAWFAHNSDSFLSTSDANGPAWRSLILTTCASLKSSTVGTLIKTLLGTSFGCS